MLKEATPIEDIARAARSLAMQQRQMRELEREEAARKHRTPAQQLAAEDRLARLKGSLLEIQEDDLYKQSEATDDVTDPSQRETLLKQLEKFKKQLRGARDR